MLVKLANSRPAIAMQVVFLEAHVLFAAWNTISEDPMSFEFGCKISYPHLNSLVWYAAN